MVVININELIRLKIPWRNLMDLLYFLISYLSTNIVLFALLLFAAPYSVHQFMTFQDSPNTYFDIDTLLKILHSKSFFEHLTYFAALAALFDYMDSRYRKLTSVYLRRNFLRKKFLNTKINTKSKYISLREDIRLRLFLLESYKKNQLTSIEQRVKDCPPENNFSENKRQRISKSFERLEREYGEFKNGDIVISIDNHLLKISQDLSIEKAEKLLESGFFKEIYPVESQVDIN